MGAVLAGASAGPASATRTIRADFFTDLSTAVTFDDKLAAVRQNDFNNTGQYWNTTDTYSSGSDANSDWIWHFTADLNIGDGTKTYTACFSDFGVSMFVGLNCSPYSKVDTSADFVSPFTGSIVPPDSSSIPDFSRQGSIVPLSYGSQPANYDFSGLTSADIRPDFFDIFNAYVFDWNGVVNNNDVSAQLAFILLGNGNFDLEMNYSSDASKLPPGPQIINFPGVASFQQTLAAGNDSDGYSPYCFRGGSIQTCTNSVSVPEPSSGSMYGVLILLMIPLWKLRARAAPADVARLFIN